MRPLKEQSIARKAAILGFLPTACALIIVSTTFLVSTFVSMRRSVIDEVSTSAAMLADSVNVAVGFHDSATVRELAGALRRNRSIDRACVFDEEGRLIAGYEALGEACPPVFESAAKFRRSQVIGVQPVLVGPRRIGTVRVVGNLDRLYRTLGAQASVTAMALVAALAVAWLVVGRLQRAITEPIAALASTADRVSSTDDYSLRTEQTTHDEVGRLVQSFNKMLGTVQRSEQQRADLLQRERAASRLKDEFLATVSHELRTPLNAILGWTHILRTAPQTADTLRRGLETVERNARVQTRLIEDLIEVSRVVTGKLNLRAEVVDLGDVVRHSLDALDGVARGKDVIVQRDIPPEPALVSGDRDRLQQIVSNLTDNAIKFTPAGGTVFVSLRARGGQFEMRFRDTGVGIAPEFLPHVFERFRQADGSTTRAHGGLGLGLAIVSELVQLHGGIVVAQSEGSGRGAEFVVRLPQLLAASAPEDPQPRVPEGQLTGVRVLAVDDNADALEVVTATLLHAGARVTTASTGAEALEHWTLSPADVLLCDLGLPGMDGFEIVRRIRASNRALARPTFAVALTAYTTTSDVERALEAGFDAHVSKPFAPAQLVATIAATLGVGR